MRFTFKICQIIAGTSMIRQFHEYFESHFWRVFDVSPNCGPVRGPPDYRKSGIPLELIYNVPGAVAEFWGPVGP